MFVPYNKHTNTGIKIRNYLAYTTILYATTYRLVRKEHPHKVSYVEAVEGARQLHLRVVSRARLFKVNMLGAGQSHLMDHIPSEI